MLKYLTSFFNTAITDFDDRGRVVELRFITDSEAHEDESTGENETAADDGVDPPGAGDSPHQPQHEKTGDSPRTLWDKLVTFGKILLVGLSAMGLIGLYLYLMWLFSWVVSNWLALPRWIGFVVMLFLVWCVPKLFRHTFGKIKPSHDVDQIVHIIENACNSVCPGCMYELDESLAESDGCTVCPECGAAWNIARWKSEHGEPEYLHDRSIKGPAKKLYVIEARGYSVSLMALQEPQARLAKVLLCKKWVAPEMGIFEFIVGVLAFFATSFAIIWWMTRSHLDYFNYIAIILFASAVMGITVPVMTSLLLRRSALHRGKAVGVASEMLALSKCPCCEEPLGSQLTVRDGVKLCNTCHAAWLPDGKVEPWRKKPRWNVNMQKSSSLATGPSGPS